MKRIYPLILATLFREPPLSLLKVPTRHPPELPLGRCFSGDVPGSFSKVRIFLCLS
jgi:hypothetical protein